MKYGNVNSSWVERLGWNEESREVYVGTKSGKIYRVSNVGQGDLSHLASLVDAEETVGSVISNLFKVCPNEECTEEEAIAGTLGAKAQPHTSTTKGRKLVRAFADLLLPQARTGLFAFG